MFRIYSSNVLGQESNCVYSHAHDITDEESLRNAVMHDYVCAEYKNNYRLNDNFISSDCLPVDCDNNHSENPEDWVTTEKVKAMFPGVSFGVHYSRHHNMIKGDKSARPRAHYFFAIEPINDAAEYANLKKKLNSIFPYFDKKALDAARFFYGTENPQVEMVEGIMTLSAFLDEDFDADMDRGSYGDHTIRQGSRNSEMSHIAGKLIKRYGNTQEARQAFLEMAAKCDPPLSKQELKTIWNSAKKFGKKIEKQDGYVSPEEYNKEPEWETPIPFSKYTMPDYPIDALPADLGDYAKAVAQSTQTPVDMAGSVALSILSVCLQGKYTIQAKSDWKEPLNSYFLIIAAPSERKSAVLNLMLKPVNDYESEYNKLHASNVEASKMRKRVLERRQKAIEDQVSKGKAENDALMQIAQEIADFQEEKPLQLYVDDITTEKLVSVLSANHGRTAIISSEGGIFDTLSGIYTKNVNIDVMLKGYSGDPIRVDRVGRESESINNPALSLLLMAQPRVIADVLKNKTFRGRGLTARFLYCMPKSLVGRRKFASIPMSKRDYVRYETLVKNLLEDDYTDKVITISKEARELLAAFSEEIEAKLSGEYAEIADWAGRIVGTTVRIAGLLCRADIYISHDFLDAEEVLVVSDEVMGNAIRIGRYYLSHAQGIYSVLPENDMYRQAEKIITLLRERSIKEFDRREMMRICRSFKTVSDIQPVLDFLDDYGYIDLNRENAFYSGGRPPLPKYRVNPMIFGN